MSDSKKSTFLSRALGIRAMNKGRRISRTRENGCLDTDPPPISKRQCTATLLQRGLDFEGTALKPPRCGKFRYADKKAALSARNLRLKGRKNYRHNRPRNLRAYPCPDIFKLPS